MKREIKFRGMTKSNNVMVFGDLIVCPNGEHRILWFDEKTTYNERVQTSTIGQFTGLKDAVGVEIYEGDIIVCNVNNIFRTAAVYYDELQVSFWMGKSKENGFLTLNDWMRGTHEVIGNVYQNPELLSTPTDVL